MKADEGRFFGTKVIPVPEAIQPERPSPNQRDTLQEGSFKSFERFLFRGNRALGASDAHHYSSTQNPKCPQPTRPSHRICFSMSRRIAGFRQRGLPVMTPPVTNYAALPGFGGGRLEKPGPWHTKATSKGTKYHDIPNLAPIQDVVAWPFQIPGVYYGAAWSLWGKSMKRSCTTRC